MADDPHLVTSDKSMAKKMYMRGSYHRYVADDPRAVCPQCKYTISIKVPCAAQATVEGSAGGGEGYVKDVATYMMMNN